MQCALLFACGNIVWARVWSVIVEFNIYALPVAAENFSLPLTSPCRLAVFLTPLKASQAAVWNSLQPLARVKFVNSAALVIGILYIYTYTYIYTPSVCVCVCVLSCRLFHLCSATQGSWLTCHTPLVCREKPVLRRISFLCCFSTCIFYADSISFCLLSFAFVCLVIYLLLTLLICCQAYFIIAVGYYWKWIYYRTAPHLCGPVCVLLYQQMRQSSFSPTTIANGKPNATTASRFRQKSEQNVGNVSPNSP